MKKLLLLLLLAMLFSFMFPVISQAGKCIYLYSFKGSDYYYDSSDVKYSGDMVSFVLYKDNCSSSAVEYWDLEIDCVKRMIRDNSGWVDGDWEPIRTGSFDDTLRIKLCK